MLIGQVFKFTVKALLAVRRKNVQKVSKITQFLPFAPRGYLRRDCLPIYEIIFSHKYARAFVKYNIIVLFELH